MKKQLLFLSLLGVSSYMFSQITVAENNNVGIGTDKDYVPESNLEIGVSKKTGSPSEEMEAKRLSLAPVTHSGANWIFTVRDNNPHANLDIGYGLNKNISFRHDGHTIVRKSLTVEGTDFILGGDDGRDIGTKTSQRALVHGGDDRLVINYTGDFEGGTRISGSELLIDGNVGIGTTTPKAKLDVNGSIILDKGGDNYMTIDPSVNVSSLNPGGTTGGASITNRKYGHLLMDIYGNDNADSFAIRTDSNQDGTLDKIAFVVNNLGNVISFGTLTVGTTQNHTNLAVNGQIFLNQTRIHPDYVFQKYYQGKSSIKDDYSMPTLEEVEAFTKEHNHLPDVPSYEEVQKEGGIDLGQMTNVLLQKIEELTLYTIEQQKLIKNQQELLEEHKEALKAQKEELKNQALEIEKLKIKR